MRSLRLRPCGPADALINAQECQKVALRAEARLQGLSMDVRPEVRNSAARTLFAVVAGQGGRMSALAWEECLWQMLFPLLRSVHHLAATSSKEEVRAHAPAAAPLPCYLCSPWSEAAWQQASGLQAL